MQTMVDHWLPWWLGGIEAACNAGDVRSIAGLGKSPGGGNGNPLQYSFRAIPWTEKPGRLESVGSQRVGYNLAAKQQQWLII